MKKRNIASYSKIPHLFLNTFHLPRGSVCHLRFSFQKYIFWHYVKWHSCSCYVELLKKGHDCRKLWDIFIIMSTEIKVARSDFWVTIPFNFERLEQHHYQSNRKSNVRSVLENNESFKWSTFHQDLSYHSNEMKPCPTLQKTQ